MSYILDALRRADAERERGAVPGLHAHEGSAGLNDDEDEAPAGRAALPWVAAAVGALLAALVAWWLWPARPEAPPSPPPFLPPMNEPRPDAPMAGVRPPPSAPTLPGEGLPPSPPTLQAPAVLKPLPPAPAASLPPVARPAAPMAAGASAAVAAAVASAPAASTPGRTGPAPAAPIPALAELPEALRSQLPPLAVGGSMYSENAAQRMVILDGRLLREGEALSAELTLEQVRAKSAVLRFRDQRFELKF